MSSRLLTLTGAGGSGKTRLALEVATGLLETYPDGVWLVDFSPLTDSTLLPNGVASTLGIQEQAGQPVLDTLISWLKEREILLLLDNCEHLVEGCAELANALLRACPDLHVLATSRETLRLGGEMLWQVPPLTLPDSHKQHSYESLTQYEAIQLFVERARHKRQGFILTEENVDIVAEICRRLDGLPLAIELAAARSSVLSVEQIRERLNKVFKLLTTSSKTTPPRQRTLEAAIEWSYTLLPETERQLLKGLSVFMGNATLESVEAVFVMESDQYEVLDLLSNLVEKSLVITSEKGDEVRYQLLETIRQYVYEKLEESGKAGVVRERHARYFTMLAERAETQLNAPHQAEWLARLEEERDNSRAALRWALDNGEKEVALRLVSAIRRFFYMRGYLNEARRWLEASLVNSEEISSTVRAKALYAAGLFAYYQSDVAQAKTLLEESLALYRALGDNWGIATVLNNLGLIAFLLTDYDGAELLLSESLNLYRAVGDLRCTGMCLNNLGFASWKKGDHVSARLLFEEAEKVLKEVEDEDSIAWSYFGLSHAAFSEGEYSTALTFVRQSLSVRSKLTDKRGIADCLDLTAEILGVCEAAKESAMLFGSAHALREAINVPVPSYERRDYEKYVATVRAQLGDALWRAAWEQGLAMSMEEALLLALGELLYSITYRGMQDRTTERNKVAARDRDATNDELTRREIEVLHLLAEGLTNDQIATRLFLSRNTVHAHLHSIYGKLDVSTRGAAIRFALDKNLLQRA